MFMDKSNLKMNVKWIHYFLSVKIRLWITVKSDINIMNTAFLNEKQELVHFMKELCTSYTHDCGYCVWFFSLFLLFYIEKMGLFT